MIPELTPEQRQREAFDAAMKQFHAHQFAAAIPLFETAAAGPAREITHVARQHINMCKKRMPAETEDHATPEELFNLGLGLLVERRLEAAQDAFQRALNQKPGDDSLLYNLSLCAGLRGDLPAALEFLQRSIQINPKNRTIARTDPDFLEFGRQSPLRELVFAHVEKKEA